MTLTNATTPIDSERPWPGLASFTEERAALFHGRRQAVEALLRRIEGDDVTVLYGKSGAGKSSLLDAGLFPALRRQGDLPVRVRLRTDAGATPLVLQFAQALTQAFVAAGMASAPLPSETQALWEVLHDPGTEEPRLVLVFDQFEEVVRTAAARRAKEAERSADKLPVSGDPLECEDFLGLLEGLLLHRPPDGARRSTRGFDGSAFRFKLLITLREDRLGEFAAFGQRCGIELREPVRLDDLSEEEAIESVLGTGGPLVDRTTAKAIVDYVVGRRVDHPEGLNVAEVSPPILSLVCYRLNALRLRSQPVGQRLDASALVQPRVEGEPLGDGAPSNDLLLAFYSEAMAAVGDSLQRFVEDELVRPTGERDLAPLSDAVRAAGGDDKPVRRLIDEFRLLREIPRNDAVWLELSHDVLLPAAARRRARRAADEALEHQRTLLEKERRERRVAEWQRNMTALVAAALLFAAVSGFLAKRAQKERDVARERSQLLLVAESQNATQAAGRLLALPHLDSMSLLPSRVLERLGAPIASQIVRGSGRVLTSRALTTGPLVVTADSDSTVSLWRGTWRTIAPLPLSTPVPVTAAWAAPDGSSLVTGHVDGSVRLWRLADTPRVVRKRDATGSPVRRLSGDGGGNRFVIVRDPTSVDVWFATDDVAVPLPQRASRGGAASAGSVQAIGCSSVSPDGRWVVASTGSPRFTQLSVWRLDSTSVRSVDVALATSPPSPRLLERWMAATDATVSEDGEAQDGRFVVTLPCPEFDPSSTRLAIPRSDEAVQIWRLSVGDGLPSLTLYRELRSLASVTYESPVAPEQSGETEASPDRFRTQLSALAFPARGSVLLGTTSGGIRIWDLERDAARGLPAVSMVSVSAVTLAPRCAESTIVGDVNGIVRLPERPSFGTSGWQPALAPGSDATPSTLDLGVGGVVSALHISADCQAVLTTYENGSFALWDPLKGGTPLSWIATVQPPEDEEYARSAARMLEFADSIKVIGNGSGAVLTLAKDQLHERDADVVQVNDEGTRVAWRDATSTFHVRAFGPGGGQRIASYRLAERETVLTNRRLSVLAFLRRDSTITIAPVGTPVGAVRPGMPMPFAPKTGWLGDLGRTVAFIDSAGGLWLRRTMGDRTAERWVRLDSLANALALTGSPDESRIGVIDGNGSVQLFKVDGTPIRRTVLQPRVRAPLALEFSPNGGAIAIAGLREVEVMDLQSNEGSWIGTYAPGLLVRGARVRWWADGSLGIGSRGVRQVWALGGAAVRRRISRITSVCLTPEERTLVFGTDRADGKTEYRTCLARVLNSTPK